MFLSVVCLFSDVERGEQELVVLRGVDPQQREGDEPDKLLT